MNCAGRDEQLLARLRVMDFAFDRELHLAFQDDHHFIGGVREILPPLPWRIGPEIATEAAGRPVGGDLLAVGHGFVFAHCGILSR